MTILRASVAALLLATSAGAAHAGEWQADRLRGVVLMMVDGEWEPIERGMLIDDSRVIRTGANGRATFRSGEQSVELERNTQIQISAIEGRDHTWILHAGGRLTADVEARDVEHFGVVTEHMVAVVKGTRFTVDADGESASVGVERGNVAVNESDRGLSVTVAAGQQASSSDGQLSVSGTGELPVVRDAAGRAVEPVPAAPAAGNRGNSAAAVNSANAGPQAPGRSGGRGNSAENANGNGNPGGNGNGNNNGNGSNAGGNGNGGSNAGGNGNGGGNSNAGGNGGGGNNSGGNGNGNGKRP